MDNHTPASKTNPTIDFLQDFPYPTIREEQKSILTALGDNWSKYNVFVIDAPTGSGKSGCAVAIGSQFKSYLLTESKSLQDQYLREFPNSVKSLKGKANYVCAKNDAFTVETSPCQVNQKFVNHCLDSTSCFYYSARNAAMISNIFLTNYNYFFLFSQLRGRQTSRRDVVICDEGHIVSEKLADMTKIVVSLPYLIKTYRLDKNIFGNMLFDVTNEEEIYDNIRKIAGALETTRLNLYENLAGFFNIILPLEEGMTEEQLAAEFNAALNKKSIRMEEVGKQVQEVMNIIKGVSNQITKLAFYVEYKDDTWVFDVDEETFQRLTIMPIDARRIFKTSILANCEKVILMSASIGSVSNLAEELGLEKDEICYISCDSPFDPKKAPIHMMGEFDFGFKVLDKTLPKAVSIVDEILEMYQDDKGIIHAGNYKITNYILKHSKFRHRLIGKATDDPFSNEALFEQHANSSTPTVLISPSMHTGIDLKGELSKFQIIVKFPFSSLQDRRTKIKMEQSSVWYANETWKKIIQASGRSIRTAEDEAATFILDKAVYYQYKLFKNHLPEWFKRRIVWHEA